MADHETLAAILAAGMLPAVAAPGGPMTEKDEARIHEAAAHAVGLYRAVLGALSVGT
jgi:hypothetical protein